MFIFLIRQDILGESTHNNTNGMNVNHDNENSRIPVAASLDNPEDHVSDEDQSKDFLDLDEMIHNAETNLAHASKEASEAERNLTPEE